MLIGQYKISMFFFFVCLCVALFFLVFPFKKKKHMRLSGEGGVRV